ncbi:MAG TPA: DUF3800 domain-containing protein [Chitinophaga sp.]|uniref:DUF3800 domain-containing protein n=1 Tax=Chitinophaga sp. TaxID=1869181 RepID=UPI002DBCCD4E|nr:DUF3800 domain-containing protein [Chitinophaga sp.]HEU4556081.1 DUF3800 domain-containing protein [Chitinophaga sp.]
MNPKGKLYHIYCDESRQSKDRFMIIGGIIIPAESVQNFEATMQQYRAEQNMHAELKWSKVTNQKYKEYQRFIDYFFALNNTDKLHFKAIVIDNHQVNHHKYNNGNKELGFYKFYYQLLLHCFGLPCYKRDEQTRFIIHPDHRHSSYSLGELKVILNRGLSKKLGIQTNAFVAIEPKDSRQSEIVQIVDIILGAIGFQKNGYQLLADSRKAKIDLVNYIARSAGLPGLTENTSRLTERFTIWNFKLRQ